MEYVTLGKIVKPLGLKGEVKIYSCSDFRRDRYYKGAQVFLYDEKSEVRQLVKVSTYRMDGQMDIVSFETMKSVESVEPYINWLVQVEKNRDELPKGHYFYSDLQNCQVADEDGHILGHVTRVEQYAAYKTLRVARDEGQDLLIPFLPAFIVRVDLEKQVITIHVLEGLL